MKSFGVRVAAGAVTIMLGALAALQAQKDRQEISQTESWTAEMPPSLETAPSPIAQEMEPAWMNSDTARIGASENPVGADSAIRLVQHTEPIDTEAPSDGGALEGIELPTLSVEATESPDTDGAIAEVATPDWALPPGQTENTPTENTQPGDQLDAMAFPATGLDAPAAESPGIAIPPAGPEAPAAGFEAPAAGFETPAGIGAPVGSDASTAGLGSPAVATGAAAGLDEFDFSAAPTFSNDPDSVAAQTNGQSGAAPTFGAPRQPSATADFGGAQPPNALRSSPGGNQLRDGGEVAAGAIAGAAIGAAAVAIGEASETATTPTLKAAPVMVDAATNGLENAAAFGAGAAAGTIGAATDAIGGTEFDDPNNFAVQGQQPAGFAPSGFATNGEPTAEQAPNSFANSNPVPVGQAPTIPAEAIRTGNGNLGYENTPAFTQPQAAAAPEARIASLPGAQGVYGEQPSFQEPTTFQQPSGAEPIQPNGTIASPGDRRLEGVQSPRIVIQKRAPNEVKVGKPASFVIQVQNVGAVDALDVRIHDAVPTGMRLVDASPTPVMQGERLLWQLGTMAAGEERTVTMKLVPEQEGELGSVARVTFEAAASVRTISTRPELKIVQRVPAEKILIGQQLEIDLEVSNPGTGEATGVTLQEDVPEGLEHPKGRQLDNLLGSLAPGEVRRQVLRLRAVAPGVIQNTIRLIGDDGLKAEHTVTVEVISPQLAVELLGPKKKYLERQATYNLQVANNGTAPATNVEIAVQLDRGFTFVSTDAEGQYDPNRHAVYWSLASLPAGRSGTVPLTLLPVEEGEQAINLEARADSGLVVKSQRTISVEAFADLEFQVSNQGGPIEIGAETVYEVKVNNTGSKNDTNVQVQLQLPPGLELVSADGEAGTDGRGLVVFQPIAELAAGQSFKHRLRVRGVSQGTHLVKAVVNSDQSAVPVTKEESTRVYSDQ